MWLVNSAGVICTKHCCKEECLVIRDPIITSFVSHFKCLMCFDFTCGSELLRRDLYRGETACGIFVILSNYFSIYTPSHWENNSLQESHSRHSLTFCHAFISNQPGQICLHVNSKKIHNFTNLFSFNCTVSPLLMLITHFQTKVLVR